MKRFISLLLVLFILTLSSCGVPEIVDEARGYSERFILSLDEDLEKTMSFMHPDFWPGADRFDEYLGQLERAGEIDFSDGIEVLNGKFNSLGMELEVGGTYYTHIYEIVVSNKTLHMYVTVVNDGDDYGVYYFGLLDPDL